MTFHCLFIKFNIVKNMSCYRLSFWKNVKSYEIVQKKLKGHSSKKVTFIVLKFRPAFFHICMQLLSFQILDIMNEGSDFGMSTIIEHVMGGVKYLSLLTSIYHISWNERCLRGPPAIAAAPQVRTGPRTGGSAPSILGFRSLARAFLTYCIDAT